MSGESAKQDVQVSVGKDFVIIGTDRVEVSPDRKNVTAYTNDSAGAKAAPEIGDEMEDGTILAGYYEDKPLYTTPRDEPLTVRFEEAATQAGALNMTNALSHHDWRVPSKGELNVLWENRNKGKLAGTFNETGLDPAGWYWSASKRDGDAWAQHFSDGDDGLAQRFSDGFRINNGLKTYVSSLRCVR